MLGMSKSSLLHYGELIFMGFIVIEFLSIHLTDAAGTISSLCLRERGCAAKLRQGISFDRYVNFFFSPFDPIGNGVEKD